MFHDPVASDRVSVPPLTVPLRLTVPPVRVQVPTSAPVTVPPRLNVPPVTAIVPALAQTRSVEGLIVSVPPVGTRHRPPTPFSWRVPWSKTRMPPSAEMTPRLSQVPPTKVPLFPTIVPV